MSIVKLNNRSVKDITAFGSITSLGSFAHISTQTASSSASISFTSGIDSTYKEYIFYFVDIHPQTDGQKLTFQGNASGGSGYNETITSTFFRAYNEESGGGYALSYDTGADLAQGTSFQEISDAVGSDTDQCCSGTLHLFNPSSTTFVKHFICDINSYFNLDYTMNAFTAGYFNTTSAIDALQFKMSSGNVDSGTITLYGIN